MSLVVVPAVLLSLIAAFVATAFVLGWVFSGPRYRGPESDHFDGARFRNLVRMPHSPIAFFQWQMRREKGPWSKWVEVVPAPPPPRSVGGGDLRVTLVNHSTVLLQFDGLNILTDPVWSKRVSPVSWAGPKRHKPPGIRFEDLPPIDAVLLSHNHYDHLDMPTLNRLAAAHDPQFVVPLGNRALLRNNGIPRTVECDWWSECDALDRVHLIAVPAQHFSSRGIADRDATLWTGWVLAGAAGRIYFAGDTGLGPHIEAIARRFSPFRLSLLPIGAFRPRWFMKPVHMSPEDAVRAHITLRSATSVAIHHGTFFLGDDGQNEPADELRRILAEAREDRFRILENGESWEAVSSLQPPVSSS